MRIKIIGDNNCARATRHILRMAGFAVTEYLPVEAIISAPHCGYAITIDLAEVVTEVPSSGNTPDASGKFFGSRGSRNCPGAPAFMPERSTLDQPAEQHGEAFADSDVESADGSSLAFFSDGGGCDDVTVSGDVGKGAQTEVHATGVGGGADASGGRHICFDSVDSELEAAVLRHVTQLAALPVIVDRPGGRVRSERELRLVVPLARNADGESCMDEAAAVAVELGVLRGMLDLFSGSAGAGEIGSKKSTLGGGILGRGLGESRESGRRKKKWWRLACFLVWMGAVSLSVTLLAAPRIVPRVVVRTEPVAVEASGMNGAHLRLIAALPLGIRGALPAAALIAMLTPAAMPEPLPAQGQFATGGPAKITDGTNTLVVDPCKGQTRLFASINQTANTQLVAGTSSKKIYICSIHVVVAAATSVALVEGTGSACGTGTAGVSGFGGATAATGWNFAANGGIAYGNGEAAVGAEGTAADNLCLFNSGSGQVSGGLGYVVQ